MNTPARFQRLLDYLTKNHPAYNIQLAYLENQINRNKLQTNPNYKNAYNRIKASVGAGYNQRVAKGRKAILNIAATLIQRHWRGTKTRKPKIVLVKNPNNGNLMLATTVRPILKKIHTAKVRRNIAAALNN